MKKILSVLSLFSIFLLSACSWMYTLDVNGNVTLTVDKIDVNTVEYKNYDVLVVQNVSVTVRFTNTTTEDIDFKISDAIAFDKNDKEYSVTTTLSSLSTSVLTGKLIAGKSVEYNFYISTLALDDNTDDCKISFKLNDSEIFIQLKDIR